MKKKRESLLQENLNDFELTCLPVIVKGIGGRAKGKAKPITNLQIQEAMTKRKFGKLSDARVRKIISYIRNNNLLPLLCANSNGYFVAENLTEFDKYLQTFEKRVNTQLKTLKELKHQREAYLKSKNT
jgi:hypothetical protein